MLVTKDQLQVKAGWERYHVEVTTLGAEVETLGAELRTLGAEVVHWQEVGASLSAQVTQMSNLLRAHGIDPELHIQEPR